MRKIFRLWMFLVPMALGIASCTDTIDNPAAGPVADEKPFANGQYVDESVRPGDNFYAYALGKWLDSEDPDIPPFDMSTELLQEAVAEMYYYGSDPVLDALRSLIAQSKTSKDADVKMLKERVELIEGISTQDELLSVFAKLQQLGYQPLLHMGFAIEESIIKGTLGIGYVSSAVKECMEDPDEAEALPEIVSSQCNWLKALGYSDERITEVAEHALDVEMIELQAYSEEVDMLRKPYRPITRAARRSAERVALCQLMGFNLSEEQIMENEDAEKQAAIDQLVSLLMEGSEESIATLRDYMLYNLVSQDLRFISGGLKISDEEVLAAAMESAKYYTYRISAEAFGLQNIHKQECNAILEEFRAMLARRIEHLDWMGESTKEGAVKKLQAMKFCVGYPDSWNDAFTPEVKGETLLEAVTNLRQQRLRFTQQTIGEDVQQNGWDFFASLIPFTTENAMYVETANVLVILPCFLVSPAFDTTQSDAALYGGAAAVFGHEMCHGFDANGAGYDERGALKDWWTAADKEAFQARQQELVKLYNQLDAYPGQKADGGMTLAENMADYGGVTIALECYKQRITQQGFAGKSYDEQLRKFWFSYATNWMDAREFDIQQLAGQYQNDVHSAGHNRCNGIVRLFDEWYDLFDVKPSDELYVKPEERVKIW